MGLTAKCAACTAGAGTIAAGGVGIHHLMQMEPYVITLEKAETKPTTGKWWESYSDKNKLVSNNFENAAWWNWKYKHVFKPFKDDTSKATQLDDHFKSVDAGYSVSKNSPNNTLNQACWEAYEKDTSSMTSNTNLQNNVKAFCSIETSAA